MRVWKREDMTNHKHLANNIINFLERRIFEIHNIISIQFNDYHFIYPPIKYHLLISIHLYLNPFHICSLIK